jgi:hypothetical protein
VAGDGVVKAEQEIADEVVESGARSESVPKTLESSAGVSSPVQRVAKGKRKTLRKRRANIRRKDVSSKTDGADHSQGTVKRNFPSLKFEEALALPMAIQQFASGEKVRRLTLFENLGKAPDSGPSRQLVTNSAKYGLTKGSYVSEHLELTPDGRTATNPDIPKKDQVSARFRLAIENIAPFKSLYDRFKGNKLPAQAVLRDALLDSGYSEDESNAAVDLFVVNAKFLQLLRTIAGAERLLPIEHVIEELPTTPASKRGPVLSPVAGSGQTVPASASTSDWSKVCFYISPIGASDSEHRMHSDLFLGSIIEPAMEELGLTVIRADQIGKPGMITAQVLEHVLKSRLVIADLSFHNPNVFYELSLRHVSRLPTVQVIRELDPLPFDLDQFRTIRINTNSIYTLVPKLAIYRAEVANQARRALEDPDAVDNPLSLFYPNLKISVGNPANG